MPFGYYIREQYTKLICGIGIHILDEKHLLISQNEMIHTPDNILSNKNIVMTSFNDKWAGLRLTGFAKYYTEGRYMDLCNKLFKTEKNTPKGAIVIEVVGVESIA